jgi:hypothetical protein
MTLVTGKVAFKTNDGIIMEVINYYKGKAVGDYFQYNEKGEVMSHGFGVEIRKYETSLNGFNLTYCILSIAQFEYGTASATLYMDNDKLFEDKGKIIQLSKHIFEDYSAKYSVDKLLIFDSKHEYTISKSATIKTNFIIDTIQNARLKKINIH